MIRQTIVPNKMIEPLIAMKASIVTEPAARKGDDVHEIISSTGIQRLQEQDFGLNAREVSPLS